MGILKRNRRGAKEAHKMLTCFVIKIHTACDQTRLMTEHAAVVYMAKNRVKLLRTFGTLSQDVEVP